MRMATVCVVTLAALTVYIVLGLLALARVPDPGTAARRFRDLVLWPVAAAARRAPAAAVAGRAPAAPPASAPVAAAPAPPAAATAAPAGMPVPDQWERFVRRLTS